MLLRFITLSRWDQPAACGDLRTFAQVTSASAESQDPTSTGLPHRDRQSERRALSRSGRASGGNPAVLSPLSPLAVPLLLKPRVLDRLVQRDREPDGAGVAVPLRGTAATVLGAAEWACDEDWCRILSHLVRSGHALTTQVLAPPRLPEKPTVFKSVRNSLSAAAL